jgi:DNA-binding LacI/PurR family transcriptional regulator/DNA-binding transcriptional regulator YhcF (GntR family)
VEALLDRLAIARFSSRNATEELRRLLMDFLRDAHLEPGTRLATEAEMLGVVKLSRSTIRRALEPLEKDGWIDRIAGSGTYVGRRIRELAAVKEAPAWNDVSRVRRSRGIVRVAVLIFRIGDLANDWYTPRILQGLDDASDEHRIAVELLGDRDADPEAISRRLELSRPDALVCLSNQPRHAFVLRDAQRLGIHCFVSGTPLASLGLPGVCEDNRQAMTLAVDHLLAHGHTRIGVVLPRLVEPWVFDRLDAYSVAMSRASLSAAVHWCDSETHAATACEMMEAFVRGAGLTALVPSHVTAMRSLDRLVSLRRLRVPDDVSVVSFEQDHADRGYLGHPDVARIVFPLREMGQRLASMARHAVDSGQPASTLQVLPAALTPGTSVRALRDDEQTAQSK